MALPGKALILIVDDNPAVARITSQILAVAGYEAVVAESGEEALQVCSQFSRPLDLLISDVVMPGMSGPELCRRLSRDGFALRCLLISGYSKEQLGDTVLGVEAFPMLVKPYTMSELLKTVRGLLGDPVIERAQRT